MENLVKILLSETKELKNQYIEMTENWAKKEFVIINDRIGWTAFEYCQFFGIEARPFTSNEKIVYGYPSGFYNTKNAVTLDRLQREAFKVKNMGEVGFIEIAVVNAVQHFENCVSKLAFRIIEKGLDLGKIEVKNSYVGINLNTTVTDGNQTVIAKTIFANGEINKPHFRYLVK